MEPDENIYWDEVNPAIFWPWFFALIVTLLLIAMCTLLLAEIVSEFSYFCPKLSTSDIIPHNC